MCLLGAILLSLFLTAESVSVLFGIFNWNTFFTRSNYLLLLCVPIKESMIFFNVFLKFSNIGNIQFIFLEGSCYLLKTFNNCDFNCFLYLTVV